jgi:TonB family protein
MSRSHKLAAFLLVSCCAASSLADDEGAWAIPKLPQWVVTPKDQDWYPADAQRTGLEGRVLVAFDITADGRAKSISVLWAEDSLLGVGAVQLLKGIRFKVPPDWGTADLSRRWRLGFVYRLCPSGQTGDFAIPVETVYITGSRLRGAPVHTAPANKQSDTCLHARS